MSEHDPFEEFDSPPMKLDRETIARAIVDGLGDWYDAEERICRSCGGAGGLNADGSRRTPQATHFRQILRRDPENPGKYLPDESPHPELCFECAQELDARIARASEARKTIARIVPPLFEGKTFAKFETPPGDDAALRSAIAWHWRQRRGRSLYLWDRQTGTGKSHLAYAIIQREVLDGRTAVTLEWADFLGKLRATFNGKFTGKTDGEIQTELERAELVLIDDLGPTSDGGKPTEFAVDRLWRIVNARHIAERQVIVTSNLPLDDAGHEVDLARWLGPGGRRIVSRLSSMCDVVRVRGADVRSAREQLSLGGAS